MEGGREGGREGARCSEQGVNTITEAFPVSAPEF